MNGTSVSNTTFRAELSAISSSTTLQCYLEALAPANYAAGAGSSVATTGATAATGATGAGMEGADSAGAGPAGVVAAGAGEMGAGAAGAALRTLSVKTTLIVV